MDDLAEWYFATLKRYAAGNLSEQEKDFAITGYKLMDTRNCAIMTSAVGVQGAMQIAFILGAICGKDAAESSNKLNNLLNGIGGL